MVTFDQNLIPVEVQSWRSRISNRDRTVAGPPTGNNPADADGGLPVVPVLGSFPTAGWISVGGRKPTTTMNWTSETLKAEEIAATLDVPTAYIDDAGFPLWASVQPRMVEALAVAIDEAVFFGVGAPASFPAGGVFAFSTPCRPTGSGTRGRHRRAVQRRAGHGRSPGA